MGNVGWVESGEREKVGTESKVLGMTTLVN